MGLSGTPAQLINDPRVRETYLGNTFRGDEFGAQTQPASAPRPAAEPVAGKRGR